MSKYINNLFNDYPKYKDIANIKIKNTKNELNKNKISFNVFYDSLFNLYIDFAVMLYRIDSKASLYNSNITNFINKIKEKYEQIIKFYKEDININIKNNIISNTYEEIYEIDQEIKKSLDILNNIPNKNIITLNEKKKINSFNKEFSNFYKLYETKGFFYPKENRYKIDPSKINIKKTFIISINNKIKILEEEKQKIEEIINIIEKLKIFNEITTKYNYIVSVQKYIDSYNFTNYPYRKYLEILQNKYLEILKKPKNEVLSIINNKFREEERLKKFDEASHYYYR